MVRRAKAGWEKALGQCGQFCVFLIHVFARWPDVWLSLTTISDRLRPIFWRRCVRRRENGITAPHIGVLKRLVVIELAASDGVRTYVNPQIVWTSAEKIRHEEGSVSMPGVREEIARHARCADAIPGFERYGTDRRGRWFALICLQHEVDQLDGTLLDRQALPVEARAYRQTFRQNAAHSPVLRNQSWTTTLLTLTNSWMPKSEHSRP